MKNIGKALVTGKTVASLRMTGETIGSGKAFRASWSQLV